MKKRNKIIIIFASIFILIFGVILVLLLNKDTKKEPENTEEPTMEDKMDVSNITDGTVIEGASREMDVINDSDADKIISEMYIKAISIYRFGFDLSYSNEDGKVQLLGYNKVMSNIFTDKGKKQFEDFYNSSLIKKDNDMYIDESMIKDEELNYDIKILSKSIEAKKVTSRVACESNWSSGQESEFIIVKENGIWKVDSFNYTLK